ncbi:hypothetical protein K1719_001826 [Acacia pycnantha]|nr:hypothetical protein K1719_001826 [Acacia pycnantha]
MKRVDRPRLSYRRSGVDQSKYCAFHDVRGHTTDECYELRDAIERFIRKGKLQQYVIEHQGKGGKRKPKSRSKSPPRKFKKHEDKRKKPAEFGDEFPETEFDCSSADILSWEAFKRMNLDQEDLKPCRTTLIGFNWEQGTLSDQRELGVYPGSTPISQKKRNQGPEKALPLFRLLKKEASIEWNTKCDEAFEGIKQERKIRRPIGPEPGETLYLYLSIGEEAISAELVREVDHSQLPVYFISKTLQNTEIRY